MDTKVKFEKKFKRLIVKKKKQRRINSLGKVLIHGEFKEN